MDCSICNSRLYSPFPRLLHCRNCGVTYFEENELNRITLKQAQLLAKDKKKEYSDLENTQCPFDHHMFALLQGESIPQYIQIYKCNKCMRVLISSRNLSLFKKAQASKISYFKNWQIPLPSLQAVLVFSFMAIVSLTVISGLTGYMQQNAPKTQASVVYSNLSIKQYNEKNSIIFSTNTPVISRIIFYNKYKDIALYDMPINTEKTRTHYLIFNEPAPSPDLYFKIHLIDEDTIVESEFIPYVLSE